MTSCIPKLYDSDIDSSVDTAITRHRQGLPFIQMPDGRAQQIARFSVLENIEELQPFWMCFQESHRYCRAVIIMLVCLVHWVSFFNPSAGAVADHH